MKDRSAIRATAWFLAVLVGCGGSVPSPVVAPPVASTSSPTSPVPSPAPSERLAVLRFDEVPLEPEFRYSNGSSAQTHSILETLGGGVALFDYDRDGNCDLFAVGGGQLTSDRNLTGLPSRLWRSDSDGHLTSVTAGVESSSRMSHGCWAADIDNDGFQELLLTGYNGLQLFSNQGDGTFQRISTVKVGLDDPIWSTGAAWGDYDGDGCLDLYVAHYVNWNFKTHQTCPDPHGGMTEICGPKHYAALDDRLFLSRGDGTFEEVHETSGLIAGGKGLGVISGDFDLDQDLDLYVANDTTDNFLYLNRGVGRFEELGQRHGVALDDAGRPTGSMGVDLADFDNDGLPDLWTANYEHEIFGLYRNLGGGKFLHVSQPMGLAAIGDRYVGWGTGFADLDRDGDLDVISATGHVKRFPEHAPVRQLPLVWLNDGARFTRQSFPSGTYLGSDHDGRGLALADLDNDGDIDLAIHHNDRPLAVLHNETPSTGGWLRVQLVGRTCARDAIGARLGLKFGPKTIWRFVCGGGSYLSQNDLRAHWGFAATDTPTELTIVWPSGVQQSIPLAKSAITMIVVEPAE